MRTATPLVLLALAACSGDKSADAPETDAPDSDSEPSTDTAPVPDTGGDTGTASTGLTSCSTPQPIGAAGGVVTYLSGSLDVPPDALAGTVDLQLCLLTAPPPTTPAAVVPSLWEVRPVDTTFALPAELSLPTSGSAESTVVVRTSTGAWRPDLGAGTADAVTATAPLWRADQAYVTRRPTLGPVSPPRDTVDVLLVIDNSCSMGDEQALMASLAGALVGPLQSAAVDWHVGVVTTDLDNPADQGNLRALAGERWAHDAMPDPVAWLAQVVQPGISGSGIERGLGAAYTALELLAAGPNAGFRRTGAPLEVLVLSDEVDATQPSLVTPAEFDTWFAAQVACPPLNNFQSIVTLQGPDRGTAYIDRSTLHGGGVSDVAAGSFDVPLTQLGMRAAGGVLPRPEPEPSTLSVWNVVPDAEPVEVTDWSWDAGQRTVTLGPTVTVDPCDPLILAYLPL